MTEREVLIDRKSSSRIVVRFLYGAILLVSLVIVSATLWGRTQSSRPARTRLAATGMSSAAISPVQTSTPILSKEYIYSDGRLIATETFAAITAWEADVAPRPNGDGSVVTSDWVQTGRFSAGLDIPTPGSEFQRADCAPRETSGNAQVTVADWVQAGRYSVALDPLQPAGGPTGPPPPLQPGFNRPLSAGYARERSERAVRIANADLKRGEIGILLVEADTLGDENALAFTLRFEAGKVQFFGAVLTEDVNGNAELFVNTKQSAEGQVGVALALRPGQTFTAGTLRLLRLQFLPGGGDGDTSMQLKFDDSLIEREIVSVRAVRLPQPAYADTTITIRSK